MKKLILAVILFSTIGLTYGFSQNETTEAIKISKAEQVSFGVRGNCGMCKTTIEKAAHSVAGVTEAQWNKEQKFISVSFDASKTDEMAIQKAVAASGYDTEKVLGDLKAYKKLPGCCKYDHSMKMNQKVKK